MTTWNDAIFYQLYPLGACGAPADNDRVSAPEPRLRQLLPWLAHARRLGCNALYLGPVFESAKHGYDTLDYFTVDRRLGTEQTLRELCDEAHRLGIRVVLDAVFGHVGRDFWAFRDLREKGEASAHRGWFLGVDFTKRSRFGDGFTSEHWKDAPELPRLNLANPAVREHLFAAVDSWVSRFGIDGLRLDSADWLTLDFLEALRARCADRPDFFLLGEVVHGDYRTWARPGALDSTTNYEASKGLWSSHVDKNFFEIGYTLERQFGAKGVYQGLPLYSFADNHDVNRVASMVPERKNLFSLSCLLFTMPGLPSIYAGSEWGLQGKRTATDDRPLRPALDLEHLRRTQAADLPEAITRLAALHHSSRALREGDYRQLSVAAEQLAFLRQAADERVIVAVNGGAPTSMKLSLPGEGRARLVDLLDPGAPVEVQGGQVTLELPGSWARVLRVEGA